MSVSFEISEAEVVRRLKAVRPGFEPFTLRFLGAGEFTRAWLANDDFVVRFARHAEAEAALRREAVLLPWLAGQLTVQIPQPEFYEAVSTEAFGFVTYCIVPGEAVTRDRFLSMTPVERDRCGAEVAQFLDQLHAMRLDLPRAEHVSVFVPQKRYLDLLSKAELILLPHLSPELTQFLSDTFSRYFDDANHFLSHDVLLHGDLSPDHVLSNIDQRAIVTGIIDFGDMQIGPPAWDLVFLYEDYGVEFMAAFLRHFRPENRDALLREMFYFYQLDMVAWVIREIEREGLHNAKKAISNLDQLRVESGTNPWRAMC